MKYRVYFTDDNGHVGYAAADKDGLKCYHLEDFLSKDFYTFNSILETKKVLYTSDIIYNDNKLWKNTIQIIED